MPSILTEGRALLDAAAHDYPGLSFFDRHGDPMTAGDWLEARLDSDYVSVSLDFVRSCQVVTQWIGVHVADDPGWDRVIFGTQAIALPRLDADAKVGEDDGRPFDIFSILGPREGKVALRTSYLTLSAAEAGHAFVVAAVTAVLDGYPT